MKDDSRTGEEPATKVPRLDEPSTSFKILPLLDSSLLAEECDLVNFRVLRVADKKKIGLVVKITPELAEEFLHLKRVDPNGRIAIESAAEEPSDEFLRKLDELGLDSSAFEILPVPTKKPVTRKQADWARKYWPTAFHPNKEIEDLLSGAYFARKERENLAKWSEIAEKSGCVVIQKGEVLSMGESKSCLLGHPVMDMIEKLAETERKNGEYLATDCDVILGREPCAMCAMALVHARAARVFFIKKSSNGVLAEGTWQMHLVPSFNHHYKAFQIVFPGRQDSEEETPCR